MALVAVIMFRDPLRALIGRIRHAKLPGLEVDIDALEVEAKRLETSVEGSPIDEEAERELERLEESVTAATSPVLAVVTIAARIEREAKSILASYADPASWRRRSLGQVIGRLEVSPNVQAATLSFQHVRNKVVHSGEATEAEAERAVALGLTILDALARIPRSLHVVVEPDLPLFLDEARREPYPLPDGYHGLLVESHDSDGSVRRQAFVSAQTYSQGQVVTWEWGSQRFDRRAYFTDPADGHTQIAWDTTSDFAGRPMDEAIGDG